MKTHWTVKSLLYASVFYFGYAHSYVNIFISDLSIYSVTKDISIFLLVLSIGIYIFLKINRISYYEEKSEKKIFYSSYLLILPVIIIFFSGSINNYDYDMFKKDYRWTNKMFLHKNLVNTAELFSNCNDFLMLVLHENNRWDTFGNKLARKSKFLGDFSHFYFNQDLYEEHIKRRNLMLNLWKYNKTNPFMYKETLKQLEEYNLIILTYSDVHSRMGDNYSSLYSRDRIGAYFVGKDQYIIKEINECIK